MQHTNAHLFISGLLEHGLSDFKTIMAQSLHDPANEEYQIALLHQLTQLMNHRILRSQAILRNCSKKDVLYELVWQVRKLEKTLGENINPNDPKKLSPQIYMRWQENVKTAMHWDLSFAEIRGIFEKVLDIGVDPASKNRPLR